MLKATLKRLESTVQGTFGRLTIDGLAEKFFTVELPWRDNAPNVSCIPLGSYRCVWTYSPRFKRMLYLVAPVLGRSGVRIHPANLASQLNGCIALGERMGWIEGKKAVLLSVPAVRRLERLTKGEAFSLEVMNGVA